METFPLKIIQDDGSSSTVDINISRLTGSSAIPIFEAHALEIYDRLCREIPVLQDQAGDWKDTIDDLCSFPGIDHESATVQDFVKGYGNVKLLLKSKLAEQGAVEEKIKKILADLPGEVSLETPEYILPYIEMANRACGSHHVVSGLTGIGFDPGGYFAKADPDSFHELCLRVKEVNSRFLENSLFRSEDPKQGNESG